MRFHNSALLLLLTTVSTVFSCTNSSKEIKKTTVYYDPVKAERENKMIDSFFDSLLPKSTFNGAILVAKKGFILFEKYQGNAHINKKDSIRSSTPFHIASTSKPFTAMAILKLAEEGKLKLSDPLEKFFPAFPYQNISIQMLLNQRSGLPNYTHFLSKELWKKETMVTNKDVLEFLYKTKLDRRGMPGQKFDYCNTNYVLLALIAEQVTGMPFPAYLKATFFDPLQMNNTFIFQSSDLPRITPSFRQNGIEEAVTFLDGTYGDKNIYSTVQDLFKWDQALYSDFFSESIKEQAFTAYSPEMKGIQNYGLGWRMLLTDSSKKIIYHNGWWHGSNTSFVPIKRDTITIICLGNKYSNRPYETLRMANEFFLKKKPEPTLVPELPYTGE